jgi:hypothetical protein
MKTITITDEDSGRTLNDFFLKNSLPVCATRVTKNHLPLETEEYFSPLRTGDVIEIE